MCPQSLSAGIVSGSSAIQILLTVGKCPLKTDQWAAVGRPGVLKLGSAPGRGLQGRHQGPLSEAHPPCPYPLQLAMGKMMEQGPVLIITFQAQMVMVIKNPKGEVVEGDPVSGQEGRGRACRVPAVQGTRIARCTGPGGGQRAADLSGLTKS